MLLDSGLTAEQVGAAVRLAAEGREAAGRTGEPFRTTVYVEVDPAGPALSARVPTRRRRSARPGPTRWSSRPRATTPTRSR
ncbi:hypothetical protein BJF78_11130 [Pseudonocardia sp. CNS-139]|nr:hypothetical protein BJF78_11130 [Pseudonocardia sp. CNS-139]